MLNPKAYTQGTCLLSSFSCTTLEKVRGKKKRNLIQLGILFSFHAAIRNLRVFNVNQINGRKNTIHVALPIRAQSLLNPDYSLSKTPGLLFKFIWLKKLQKGMQFQQVAASGFNFTDDAATKRRAILTDKSLNIGYGGEPTVPQTRNQKKSWIVKYC